MAEKAHTPNLPSTRQILEDILEPTFVPNKYPMKLHLDNDEQIKAYSCFLNLKQLESDTNKHTDLKFKLAELNDKLVENIASLKTLTTKIE